jgi:hypothetical protein
MSAHEMGRAYYSRERRRGLRLIYAFENRRDGCTEYRGWGFRDHAQLAGFLAQDPAVTHQPATDFDWHCFPTWEAAEAWLDAAPPVEVPV